MRKPRPRGRERTGTRSRDLFPPSWPVCAWYPFEQDLLAAVYARSGDLWHVLRDTCRGVSGWLRHLEYEGDIESNGALAAATELIPHWTDAEVKLQQARNLLGRQAWDSLTTRAAGKAAEPPKK